MAVDKPSLTEAAAEQLEDVGFSTRTVTDGHEALRLAAETSPRLVVLGVSTPPTGGVELMRRMHASRQTPVILVGTEGRATDRIVGLRLGADDYLVKPFVVPSWPRASKPCSGAARHSNGGAPRWQSAA